MADEILKRDQNFVTVLAGVTNDSDQDVTMLRVDPITKRLLVSASATGIGTVTSVSVVSANGFAGTVATATTTPAITISTTITGILKGNGTSISAASAGTDYVIPGSITTSGLTPPGSDTYIIFNDAGTWGTDSHFTYDKVNDVLHTHKLAGDATDGLIIESANGTDIGILGPANTANVTWYGSHNFNLATADTLAYFGASKTLSSATLGANLSLTTGTLAVTNAALTKVDDTNVTLTLGGSPTTALLNATSLTLGWTGTLSVARGGTGTGTAFTAGSVIFAGASGTYSQDNANFFWEDTNNYLRLGTALSGPTVTANSTFTNTKSANSFITMDFQNRSNGTTASTDFIWYNDAGTDSVNYLDIGINSSTYTGAGVLNGAGDAYIYNVSEDLVIGTATVGKNVIIFTGGTGGAASTKTRATFTDTGLQMMDGTAANPSIAFAGSTTTGLYESSAGVLGVSIAGVSRLTHSATTWSLNSSNGGTMDVGGTSQYIDLGGTIVAGAATFQGLRTTGLIWDMQVSRTNSFGINNANTIGGSTAALTLTTMSANRSVNVLTGSVGITITTSNAFEGREFSNGSSGTVSVTNNYAFNASQNMTIGTAINAAFHSINSANATRWNLYLEGTAQNWLAGNLGIGTGLSAPTAKLHLAAGSTAASTAPIKLTSGSLMTSPEVGAIEFLTDGYYATITTGTVRQQFAFRENNLSVFASTTSAQLAGVISDETGSGALVFANTPTVTALKIAAGTATANTQPIEMTSGTLLTSAEAGSIEYDGKVFYTTPVASARGVSPSIQGSYLSGNFTLQNASGVQSAFGTTQDIFTLEASTTYRFKGRYYMSTGTTSHSVSLAFALGGGASITSIRYGALGYKGTVNNNTTAQSTVFIDKVASTLVIPAAASASGYIEFEGIIRMNAGGTVTPQIAFSADPTGTCLMLANSFIEFYPIGSDTVANIGNVA